MAIEQITLDRQSNVLRYGAWAAAALGLAWIVRSSGIEDSAAIGTFVVIFTAIAVEALPFVLLGALVSALIEVFVPDRAFERAGRLPVALQLPAAAFGGFAFPVCECGSVPVARKLIARGLHPAAGIAFMLASPIFNPIVLASTFIAYQPRGLGWTMVAGRAGLGLLLALVGGWALGPTGGTLLRGEGNTDSSPGCAAPAVRGTSRVVHLFRHLSADFFLMAKFITIGAAIAALLQTAVPQSIVAGLARTPFVGALALMAVAFALSLCSEADAFVAVSFVQFPLGAQLAFLVFGPAVDAKLILLYGATYQKGFVRSLLALAVPVVLAGSLVFEVLIR